MAKQRLSKVLAAAGVASRRACEELIFAKRVRVNGKTALLPQFLVDAEQDAITVDGETIKTGQERVYYLLNKPVGYLCSNKRLTPGQRLVTDLVPHDQHRLFTVGRLDKETEGLLIITNDGAFAHRAMHPSSNITREYIAKTDNEITAQHLKDISAGTWVGGAFVKPATVQKMRRGTLKVTVKEGRKHEVRLLVQAAGLKVKNLSRVRFGGLLLGKLPVGAYRPLGRNEREAIFN